MGRKQDITLALKGFSILAVLINHYLVLYVSREYAEYANGIISIFFVLSGYGIFYSLNKCKNYQLDTIKDFWSKRLIKIFPLYWLSLLIYFNLRQDIVPQHPVQVALAFPFWQAPQFYWFVTSLMQCYLLAPFLHLSLKKIGLKKYLILVVLLLFASCFIFSLTNLPYRRDYFVYRYIFLGHLFLFALGLALPSLLNLKRKYFQFCLSKQLVAIALIVFALLVYYTRFANTAIMAAPFFAIAAPAFCFIALYNNLRLPTKLYQILAFLGLNSYSLYLFHLIYYKFLEKSDLFANSAFYRIILTIVFLPVFLITCILLEKLNYAVTKYCFTYLNTEKRQ